MSAQRRSRLGVVVLTALWWCAGTLGCRSNVAPTANGADSATTASPTSSRSPDGKGSIVGLVRWKEDGTPAAGVMVAARRIDSADVPDFATTDRSG